MNKSLLSIVIYLLIFVISGCQWLGNESSDNEQDVELVGTTWHLKAFKMSDNFIEIERPPADPLHYSLKFTTTPADECVAEGESSRDWCMELIGYPNSSPSTTYSMNSEDQSLTIHFRGSTLIGLPDDSMEPEFFQALDNASRYRISGRELQIFYEDDKMLLFEPIESE